MTELSDEAVKEVALHGSVLGRALALVELCDRAGMELEDVLDPGGPPG